MIADPDAVEGLFAALEIAARERSALTDTHGRLFPAGAPVTAVWLSGIATSPARGDLVEAFAARFARFQDRLGNKVLPALLGAMGEPRGPLLDNLARAHRYGWIDDPQDWIATRGLRNRLVHEYVVDANALAEALNAAGDKLAMLTGALDRMTAVAARLGRDDAEAG